MKPKIKFIHNWNNKLNCKFFTTIRKFSKEKEEYYRKYYNTTFEVLLNDKKVCEAKLINIDVVDFRDIPQQLLLLDVGQFNPQDVFIKFGIRNKTKVLLLTFMNVKK